MAQVLDTIIDRGILFLILFTALAFGSVQDWAAAVMEIAAFIVLAAWFASLAQRTGARIADRGLLVLFSLMVLFVLFQLVPLPIGLLRALSPATARLLDQAGVQAGWHSLSIYPWATTQYLLKLLAYGGVFFVVVDRCREQARVDRLVRFLLLFGLGLVVFALLQKATWNDRIYWLYPVEVRAESVRNFMIWGPFVNRNHFAGYLELIIPLGLGLVLKDALELRTPKQGNPAAMLESLASSRRFSRISLWGVVVLVLIAALFMTLSRGGIIAFSASGLLLFVLARLRRGLKKKVGPLALVGFVLVLIVMVAGWDRIEDRFQQLAEEQSLQRANVWLDSVGIARDFPLFGTGFGTFTDSYPRYQSHSSTALYDHAHNDYVELVADLGLVGTVLFLGTAILFLVRVFRQWLARHRGYVKALGAGGLASLSAMAVHGMTDFNLHIPSNALLLAVVAGLTYSVVFNVGRSELEAGENRSHAKPQSRKKRLSSGAEMARR